MADVPSSKDEDEENGFVNSIVSYIVGIIIADNSQAANENC